MIRLNFLKFGEYIVLGLLLSVSSSFANQDRYYDYARVTHSEPIYEYIYVDEPNRVCKDVRYKVRDNYDDGYYSSSSNYDDSLGFDSLVGAATGVVVGSQIGKGNGRVAAQIVGGLLGTKIAHEIRNNYKPTPRYNSSYRYETRTECYDEPRSVQRRVKTGYKNYFVYNGIKRYKITNNPINRVKITHSIDY